MKLSKLLKGMVFDMPLTDIHMKSSVIMSDCTPFMNDGVNAGAVIGTKATYFGGKADIRISNSSSLKFTNKMSAAIWVNGAPQDATLLSCYDAGTDQQRCFRLCTFASGMRAAISDNGTFDVKHVMDYGSNTTILDDSWHLVGFTFDTGDLKLYVDGIQDKDIYLYRDASITSIHNSTIDTMVGCYLNNNLPTYNLTGDLFRPRMWNRALTDREWKEWYDKTKGLFQ